MATVFKRIGFESNVTAATATAREPTFYHLDTNRLFPLQSCKLESEQPDSVYRSEVREPGGRYVAIVSMPPAQ